MGREKYNHGKCLLSEDRELKLRFKEIETILDSFTKEDELEEINIDLTSDYGMGNYYYIKRCVESRIKKAYEIENINTFVREMDRQLQIIEYFSLYEEADYKHKYIKIKKEQVREWLLFGKHSAVYYKICNVIFVICLTLMTNSFYEKFLNPIENSTLLTSNKRIISLALIGLLFGFLEEIIKIGQNEHRKKYPNKLLALIKADNIFFKHALIIGIENLEPKVIYKLRNCKDKLIFFYRGIKIKVKRLLMTWWRNKKVR